MTDLISLRSLFLLSQSPPGGFILVFTGSLGVWAAAKQTRGSTAGVGVLMIADEYDHDD